MLAGRHISYSEEENKRGGEEPTVLRDSKKFVAELDRINEKYTKNEKHDE